MKQHIKDVIIIPCIIAAIFMVVGIPLGAWYTNQPVRTLVTIQGVKGIIFASIPGWVVLILLVLLVCAGYMLYRKRCSILELEKEGEGKHRTNVALAEHIQKAKREHDAEIEAIKSKEPKLHGVWNVSQAFWGMGRQGDASMMQIGGWIDLTSSHTEDTLYLLAAYINGKRSQPFLDVTVKPNVVNREMVMLFMVPPLESDATKAYEATIVVEDQYNRKFELPRQSFRATPSHTPFPVSAKPTPELHIAWRVAGWCWTMHDGERVVRLSGDAPIQLDNMSEKILFTGVRVEGAEFVGVFDNFELEPGQRTYRGMNLDFKGIETKGKEPVTVKLTFVDFKGNLYPTKEATFKALPNPEQYNGIPWSKL